MTARIGVIGVGALVERACEALTDGGLQVPTVVNTSSRDQPRLRRKAEAVGAAYFHGLSINSAAFTSNLVDLELDFLLSADNQRIFGSRLLAVPRVCAVNFHNGPIPSYRGTNIPTWAIWNEEFTHEVCWHVMMKEIDRGPVLISSELKIDARETAFSLTMKCIDAGIQLLPQLTELLTRISNDVEALPMSEALCEGNYYSRAQLPNGGVCDPSWDEATIDRFNRAMDLGPLGRLPEAESLTLLRASA